MAKDKAENNVSCPTCHSVCKLPGSAENLPNNLHALYIIQLKNEMNK